ncbi:MAG: hypothetical protein M1445_09840 [Bacteroidetes bacterium]|nr:hypothetical protein [Bacteroidota bacterium]
MTERRRDGKKHRSLSLSKGRRRDGEDGKTEGRKEAPVPELVEGQTERRRGRKDGGTERRADGRTKFSNWEMWKCGNWQRFVAKFPGHNFEFSCNLTPDGVKHESKIGVANNPR